MEKIILFGMGKYFQHKSEVMDKYEVEAILDSKIALDEELISNNYGVKIINPKRLDICSKDSHVFLMSMYFVSMWKQLIGLGVEPSRLVYPYFEKPYFQSDEIVDEYVAEIMFTKNNVVIHEKNGTEVIIATNEEWLIFVRQLYRRKYKFISEISEMEQFPISHQFATERGTPVDRIYIEKFLEKYREYICGDVLEVENSAYTRMFGVNVSKEIVMDYSADTPQISFSADLETGRGIQDEIADCFILTQTLMYIFDLKSAAKNIIRLLKKNGIVLITCSGISQNSERCMDSYGAYYNFNAEVFKRMFEDENAEVLYTDSFGNVKTVTAHLAGLCAEDLKMDDFSYDDKYYPLIVYAVVKKK